MISLWKDLLNTGAERTLVDSKLIQNEDWTGEIIHVRAFNGTISALPLAKVRIEGGECEDELTVAVEKDLGYDTLLGDCEDELTVAVQKDLGYDALLGDCEDELTVAVEKDLGYDTLLGDCGDELTLAVEKDLGYDTLLGDCED